MPAKKVATKKSPTKPNPEAESGGDLVQQALEGAIAAMIGLVETIAQSGTGQAVTGAQGTAGGTAVEAGQSSQATQTAAAHKNDVSVPEAMESYNGSLVQDVAYMGKVNARTFDITSALVNSGLAAHVARMDRQATNSITHDNEEFSARKRATEIGLVTVGDAVEEGADDTDRT